LAKHWGYTVEERKVSVQEIVEANKNGTLTEAFGAGTAATIAHIVKIGYRDGDLILPPVEGRTFSNRVYDYLNDLKAGKIEDTFGWTLKV
jgi:branched-chain amino acid aminotransferase